MFEQILNSVVNAVLAIAAFQKDIENAWYGKNGYTFDNFMRMIRDIVDTVKKSEEFKDFEFAADELNLITVRAANDYASNHCQRLAENLDQRNASDATANTSDGLNIDISDYYPSEIEVSDEWGISVGEIDTDIHKVMTLAELVPDAKAECDRLLKAFLHDTDIGPDTLKEHPDAADDINDLLCAPCGIEIAQIFVTVVHGREDIRLSVCMSDEDDIYIAFLPKQPWEITKNEKSLTKDKLDNIFAKYLAYLTEQPLDALRYYYGDDE